MNFANVKRAHILANFLKWPIFNFYHYMIRNGRENPRRFANLEASELDES